MKATGIVRHIDEYGIIGQKSKNPHLGFSLFCPIEHKGVKKRFLGSFYT